MHAHEQLALNFAADSNPDSNSRARLVQQVAAGLSRKRELLLQAQQAELAGSGSEYQYQVACRQAELIVNNLSSWDADTETDERTKSQRRPAGVISIFADEYQPLALALVHSMYALAAGNKVLLALSQRCPRTSAAIRACLSAVDSSDLSCCDYSYADLPDHMRLRSARLLLCGWHCLSAWREELMVNRGVQTDRLLKLQPTVNVLLCSEDADLAQLAEQLVQAQQHQSGQWFACPHQLQVPRTRMVDTIKALAQVSQQNQPALRLLSDAWRAELLSQLHDLSAQQVEIRAMQLSGYFSEQTLKLDDLAHSNDWPHLLVVDPPAGHPLSQAPLMAPITVLHGYKNIGESLAYMNNLSNLGVVYSFGSEAALAAVNDSVRAAMLVKNQVPIIYQPGFIYHEHCSATTGQRLYSFYRDSTIHWS